MGTLPPSYALYATKLKFTTLWDSEKIPAVEGVRMPPWAGRMKHVLLREFPAMRKITFVLEHIGCGWFDDAATYKYRCYPYGGPAPRVAILADLLHDHAQSEAIKSDQTSTATTTALHARFVTYWKEQLGWVQGGRVAVPGWFEIEFKPRFVETTDTVPKRKVDLNDIWKIMKKEREAAKE